MKNLVAFIAANDVECTPDRISVSELEYMQKELGLSFGEQLRRYILEYGYLARERDGSRYWVL